MTYPRAYSLAARAWDRVFREVTRGRGDSRYAQLNRSRWRRLQARGDEMLARAEVEAGKLMESINAERTVTT